MNLYLCDEHYPLNVPEYTIFLMPGVNKCYFCGKDARHMIDRYYLPKIDVREIELPAERLKLAAFESERE